MRERVQAEGRNVGVARIGLNMRECIARNQEVVMDFFEGSVIVHIAKENILVESRIRDIYFGFVQSLVCFLLGLGLGLGLGFWNAHTLDS